MPEEGRRSALRRFAKTVDRITRNLEQRKSLRPGSVMFPPWTSRIGLGGIGLLGIGLIRLGHIWHSLPRLNYSGYYLSILTKPNPESHQPKGGKGNASQILSCVQSM